MHEANALTIRIFKYVSAVVSITCVFTFSKFLEGKVVWETSSKMVLKNGTLTNVTTWNPQIHPTMLRINDWYTIYYNWSRLLVLGVIPFVMLVYLNAQIFKDIKARSKRRFNTKVQNTMSQAHTQNNTAAVGASCRENATQTIHKETHDSSNTGSAKYKLWFGKKSSNKKFTTLQISGDKVVVIDEPTTMVGEMTEVTQLHSNNTEKTVVDINNIAHVKSESQKLEDNRNGDKVDSILKNGGEDIHNVPEISVITDNANRQQNEGTQQATEGRLDINLNILERKCIIRLK